jgi:FixJ family two-component response regulator
MIFLTREGDLAGHVNAFDSAQAFSSGEDFLRSPELSRTGCLVVDFDMPEMSGLDLHNNFCRLGN